MESACLVLGIYGVACLKRGINFSINAYLNRDTDFVIYDKTLKFRFLHGRALGSTFALNLSRICISYRVINLSE